MAAHDSDEWWVLKNRDLRRGHMKQAALHQRQSPRGEMHVPDTAKEKCQIKKPGKFDSSRCISEQIR